MSESEKELATITVKVTPSTHQNIRRLAAELRKRNWEAIDYAVRRALEEATKEKDGSGGGQVPPE